MSNHGDEQERRRYLRIAADEGLECAIEGAGVVHIVGISSEGGGMRVITSKELDTGTDLDCRLTRDGKDLFHGKAKPVWKETLDFEFTRRHVAGIELMGLDERERAALVEKLPVLNEPASDD
jgi:hypothetical protein